MNEEQVGREVFEEQLAAYRRVREKRTAEFHEVRRNITSQKTPDVRSNYMGMSGRISVASLLAHMATIAPDVKPEQMMLNWATVMWLDEATEEEKTEYDDRQAAWEQRRIEWERKTLVDLLAKHPDLDVERS